MACSVRTIETKSLAHRIQEDTMISSQQTQNTLAFILHRIEAMEAQRNPQFVSPTAEDVIRGGEENEYEFRMRQFMSETESVLCRSPRGSIVVTESWSRPVSLHLDAGLGEEKEQGIVDWDLDRGLKQLWGLQMYKCVSKHFLVPSSLLLHLHNQAFRKPSQ